MLKQIVYARFHSERGPVRLIEYPTRRSTADHGDTNGLNGEHESALLDRPHLSSFIIPPYELCNRALSFSTDDYHLLGWPVSIEHERYPRNRFTFNVCLLFDGSLSPEDKKAWEAIVKKTARWFREIEEDADELSRLDESGLLDDQKDAIDGSYRLRNIIEQMLDQLVAYGQCCARLSDTHVLNLKYEVEEPTTHMQVHAWHVPLLIAKLVDAEARSRNLILKRVHPYIDGISHIGKIAKLADVELELVIKCITTLAQAGAVMLLDIFHFQAVYEPTRDMAWFVQDEAMQQECSNYIGLPSGQDRSVVELYLELKRGLTVADFFMAHQDIFGQADIRRFTTFGIIKGFLRRVHKYGRLHDASSATTDRLRPSDSHQAALKKFDDAWKQAALSSGWATPPSDLPASVKSRPTRTIDEQKRDEEMQLKTYLDGKCCFDQICCEMSLTEKKLVGKLHGDAFAGLTILST